MKHLFLFAGVAVIGYTLYKRQNAPVDTLPPTPMGASPSALVAPNGGGSSNLPASLGTDAAGNSLSQIASPDSVTHDVEMSDFEHINPFSTSAM